MNTGWWKIDIHRWYSLANINFVPISARKNNWRIWRLHCHCIAFVWRHATELERVVLGKNGEMSDQWLMRRYASYFYVWRNNHCRITLLVNEKSWWRHQMETFSAWLAICVRNSPVHGESPPQRPVTRSFDVFFDLRLNKGLSKQSWGWWFETLSRRLWRHCNDDSR